MFALIGNYKDGRPILSLKHSPEYGIEIQVNVTNGSHFPKYSL